MQAALCRCVDFIGCSIHIPSKLSAAEQLLSSLLGRASVMGEVTCV